VPGPVAAIVGAHVAVLATVAGRYGHHRDELYFLEAAQHLALGYVDQPPLIPLLARVQVELLGTSVASLRVVPALISGATVLLAARLAAELGGGRGAQMLAAGAVAGAAFVLTVGHLLSTATVDFALWLALIVVGVRLLRTDEPRWWMAFGAVAGVALWNKQLVVLLAVALVGGLVVERRWHLLGSRWLLAGGVLALLIASPTIVWQSLSGWPQLEMAQALSARLGRENQALLVPMQLLMLGPLLVPIAVAGIRWLWREDEPRHRFRPLLWAYAIALVLTFATGGRPYYPLPLAAALVVAGTVALTRGDGGRRWVAAAVAINAVASLPLALPLLPVEVIGWTPIAAVNDTHAETVGWPELVDTVAAVVSSLPPADRGSAVLLTGSYGEAGALDRYGPAAGLPQAYSGHNSYWHWRTPPDSATTVIAVRLPEDVLAEHFRTCEPAARIDNGVGLDNEAQGQPIWTCRGLRRSWRDTWPDLRHYN
jgi:4-amino-4-deoxy-L-arabinose transferase-like glycosyltransferase